MHTVLTIAGSDSIGGAGIQADLKTMCAHHVYGMSAVTALTAQNTLGVKSIMNVTPEFLSDEIDMVFEDIPPDAVKIGMTSAPELISVIAERLSFYGARHIVTDPVMISSTGRKLLSDEAKLSMTEKLLPLSELITPNIPEASELVSREICDRSDMERAAADLSDMFQTSVLLKGGHLEGKCDDVLFLRNGGLFWFENKRIDNPNTHGTGCTLSSAIACNLAMGYGIIESVKNAKAYVTGAIEAGLDIGHGSGPMDHAFSIQKNEY